jgi:hypothetical protein
MKFINNLINHKNIVPLKSNIFMLNNFNSENNKNVTEIFYNPIIGSNLGIPLNLLQFIYTNTYLNENLITPQ